MTCDIDLSKSAVVLTAAEPAPSIGAVKPNVSVFPAPDILLPTVCSPSPSVFSNVFVFACASAFA